MYQLKSSDKNNSKYIVALENNEELYQSILDNFGGKDSYISHLILYDEINEHTYKVLVSALTVSDKFKFPLLLSEASLLYFILNVNYAYYNRELPFKINNMQYGITMFKNCQGDFRELDLQNLDTTKKAAFSTIRARHKALFPEQVITWKIPVSFYYDKELGRQRCCLSSGTWATYAYFQVEDGPQYKVPRDLFMPFFKESLVNGMISGDDTEDIKLAFDETVISPVLEVLEYVGFRVYRRIECDEENIDYYYDAELKGLCVRLLNNKAKLTIKDEETALWTKVGQNTYHYLGLNAEYLATKPIHGKIFIYTNG